MTAPTAPPFSAAGPATPPAAPLLQPETFTPDQSIMYLLKRVLVGLSQATTRELAMEDSSLPQWLPLFKLWRADAHTVAELARQCSIDVSTMTRMLDRLEQRDLVRRERSQADRRVVQLRLTPAGQAVAERLPAVMCAVYNRALAGFSPDEWALLQALLHRLVANAEAMAQQGKAPQ